jgi:MFS family permease
MAFGAGEGATGVLQTAQTLPFLLMSIPAGVLADRMSRARLMAAAETLRFASLLCVLTLLAFGMLTLPLLAILGFIGACGTVAYGVAAPALVPALVQPHSLPVANGRICLLVPPHSQPVRLWAARWSAGSVGHRLSAWPRRSQLAQPYCSSVSSSRGARKSRRSVRSARSATE